MFDAIMKWVPLLMAVLPFVFFCWINAKNNLKKEFRNRQFLMPAFALLYSIVMMVFANDITTGLLSFIRKIPVYIEPYSEEYAEKAKEFITGLNLTFWIFLIVNILILIIYMIVKKIFISICNSLMKSDKNASANDASLHGRIVSHFYVFQNDKNIWTVREEFAQGRTLLCCMYAGAVAISSIVFLACKEQMADEYIRTPFFPVFGIMLVGELYFFLNGYTNFEFINDVLGEDEESLRVTNYSLMRKVLRNIFPDRLMAENTVVNADPDAIITSDEMVKNLLVSEDVGMENFGTYISSLVDEGYELDHNYVSSTVDLLNGKSVLFNNPFYKDMSLYVFYPINRELLKHKKCLVILGRHGIENDVCEWISDSLTEITTVPSLWRVGMLNDNSDNLDVGVISKSDVLNVRLHEANENFFNDVSFIMLIEPSKLITTAQIGLNAIVKRCSDGGDKKIVYCSCDKNCDGLVDSLSHILMTDLSEVCATNKNKGTVSYMCWDTNADYTHHRLLPNISRYMGFGTELSFVALKNQISETTWYGGESYPVSDQFWIDRQYYYDLLKYAGHPTKQEELGKIFKATPNLWGAEVEEDSFLTVEDEGNNLYEMLRLFSTRISKQGFINIISPNYLLKEYMVDNSNVFENDPKAIPRFVADYARTERNITLRLIIMLASKQICEDLITKEFSLVGIKVTDIKRMLWYEILKWFSSPDEDVTYDNAEVKELVQKDTEGIDRKFNISIIKSARKFDLKTGAMKDYYFIEDRKFIECNVCRLTCAEYIAEDEKGNINYLGSELLDHVFHKHIPGQLLTLNGKYYEFLSLTSDNRVLIRRAADHITGRRTYRQIRHYRLSHEVVSDRIGSCKDYNTFRIVNAFADISVKVPAYLEMSNYDDFETAKTVVVNGIPERFYRNKQILRIDLPGASAEVKYAIAVLLNEIFRTIFAEDHAYLSAMVKMSEDEFADGMPEEDRAAYYEFLNNSYPLTNYLFEDEGDISDNSIYIIEDSQLDLGLLISVERNIKRIFEIVYDYLDWHVEKTELSKNPPEPKMPVFPEPVQGTGAPKKKRWIDKVKDFFKKLFGKKGKDGADGQTPAPGNIPPAPVGQPPLEPVGQPPAAPQDTPVGQPVPVDNMPPVMPVPEFTADVQAEETEATEAEEIPEDEPVEAIEAEEIPEGEPAEAIEAEEVSEDAPAEAIEAEEISEDEPVEATEAEEISEDEPVEATEAEEFEAEEVPEDEPAEIIEADEPDEAYDAEHPFKTVEEASEDDDGGRPPIMNASKMYIPKRNGSRMILGDNEPDGTVSDDIEGIEFETEDEQLGDPEEGVPYTESVADKLKRLPYHEHNYLMFGSGKVSDRFSDRIIQDTLKYLTSLGFDNSALTQARRNKDIADNIEKTYHPYLEGTHYCDFCGVELSGTEYEVLIDGRERCMQCGRTAVKTGEEFTEIFKDVLRNMEAFFGIRINVGIKVEMVNSKTLAKRLGQDFIPTSNFDARTIGLAVSDGAGYTILIENGSPRVKSMMTIAHELTHIWQYLNWDDKQINAVYGKNNSLEIYEGMSTWVEVQYAAFINEPAMAKRSELNSLYRDDEYGRGFKRYLEQYPLNYVGNMEIDTPFKHIPPLK